VVALPERSIELVVLFFVLLFLAGGKLGGTFPLRSLFLLFFFSLNLSGFWFFFVFLELEREEKGRPWAASLFCLWYRVFGTGERKPGGAVGLFCTLLTD
jgi:hypothetical protein